MKFIVLIRIIVISILITISSCSSGDISKFDNEMIFLMTPLIMKK